MQASYFCFPQIHFVTENIDNSFWLLKPISPYYYLNTPPQSASKLLKAQDEAEKSGIELFSACYQEFNVHVRSTEQVKFK